jgi:hypothetical protein
MTAPPRPLNWEAIPSGNGLLTTPKTSNGLLSGCLTFEGIARFGPINRLRLLLELPPLTLSRRATVKLRKDLFRTILLEFLGPESTLARSAKLTDR